MKTLSFDLLELKQLDETGTFSGYGAVFNNVDRNGDKIVPGAFAKSLERHLKAGTAPKMLWNHDPDHLLGVWPSLKEDSRGLNVTGKFVLETVMGSEKHALMKAGAITGMSIGYMTIADEIQGNVRLLKEIDLWEVSLCTFPANDNARVRAVKSDQPLADFARRLRDGEPPEIKEFEDILREAGVPKALAVKIASHGYAKAIRSDSEGKANDEALRALKDAARAFQP